MRSFLRGSTATHISEKNHRISILEACIADSGAVPDASNNKKSSKTSILFYNRGTMTIWMTEEEYNRVQNTIKKGEEIKKRHDAFIRKIVLERDMHINRNRRVYKDLRKNVGEFNVKGSK